MSTMVVSFRHQHPPLHGDAGVHRRPHRLAGSVPPASLRLRPQPRRERLVTTETLHDQLPGHRPGPPHPHDQAPPKHRHSPGTSNYRNTHRRSSGPSLTAGCVVRSVQAVLRPPPTPTRPTIHFPVGPVIGRHAPATIPAGRWTGEGLPGSRRHSRYVPRLIRRGVLDGCTSRLSTASMAFAPISKGSALPCPTQQAG